jgi:hypothetical protein
MSRTILNVFKLSYRSDFRYKKLRDSVRISVIYGSGSRHFSALVAVHEMSHQWWGHMVGWKTYHDQWLSEGIADFSSALYLRQFEPKEWNNFWSMKRRWLSSIRYFRRRGISLQDASENAEGADPPLPRFHATSAVHFSELHRTRATLVS